MEWYGLTIGLTKILKVLIYSPSQGDSSGISIFHHQGFYRSTHWSPPHGKLLVQRSLQHSCTAKCSTFSLLHIGSKCVCHVGTASRPQLQGFTGKAGGGGESWGSDHETSREE